ncbi:MULTISPECIES: DUF3891 family protein [Oceanobacillus]|uniref:DUF3891 family protein n=1 Tax=Oceanobacillus aidingensis TaxID=645964 RepID=A0ABV9JYJ3_9BACI|nr:DUF3891 family protein [Oceanobacillus oncorhynchi]MDM8100336.1 DUF3891 family protein [Oceanobacillus oncorhynchi]UUI40851.1 DUF3891 family protein [Oceanobacillus oncorhynchi]
MSKMIIRNQNGHFIFITQVDHASVSGEIVKNLASGYFEHTPYKDSVIYAAYQHDCGWEAFDKQPFWNDQANRPYSFIDFPDIPKTVLYTQGIEQVQEKDRYAALLCSEHYKRFLVTSTLPEAKAFVQQEAERQEWLISRMDHFNQATFEMDYTLLQFSDNLSLFACMNEPGAADKDLHPFFKNGISVSNTASSFPSAFSVSWEDKETITMEPFPFSANFPITLLYKSIPKTTIQQQGLMNAYEHASVLSKTIRINTKK